MLTSHAITLPPQGGREQTEQAARLITHHRDPLYGWKSIGIGGSSRISVMVTRRFDAM